MPMTPCFISFSNYSYEWKASYNGAEKLGFARISEPCICSIISCSFHLWMSKGIVKTFALMINFHNEFKNPICVTMGLFEMDETNGKNMVV